MTARNDRDANALMARSVSSESSMPPRPGTNRPEPRLDAVLAVLQTVLAFSLVALALLGTAWAVFG